MLDILIKNANIIDGSGQAAYQGNVGIKDGKIVLPVPKDAEAEKTIDAAGRYLTPDSLMHIHTAI